jgi:hypothetical protein
MTTVFVPFRENLIVPKLHAGFFTITPAVAKSILETRNQANRTLKQSKVEQLTHDVHAGRFTLNGESIVFSEDGALLDGQHRLAACAASGKSISSVVVVGIPTDARSTVDQGVARTTGDVFQMSGFENGNTLAAIGRIAFAWLRGDGRSIGRMNDVSRADVMGLLNDDPTLADAAKFGHRHSVTGVASPTVMGFCFWLIGQHYGVDVAESYLGKVASGEGLLLGDGALAARNRLISEGKATSQTKIEIVLRGFVNHYQGVRVSKLLVMKSLPAMPAITPQYKREPVAA